MKTQEDEDSGLSCASGCCLMCASQLVLWALLALGLVVGTSDWTIPDVEIPVTQHTVEGGTFLLLILLFGGLVYSLRIDPLRPRGRR